MTVVDVQVVVTTGGVSLHVEEAERQHDHVTLWDLEGTTGDVFLGLRSTCNVFFNTLISFCFVVEGQGIK